MTTNVRPENDRRILDLCNDIRVGTVTSEDLELLITRNIANFPNTAFADTVRVVPRNAIANQYNEDKLEAFKLERSTRILEARMQGQAIYTIYAVDTHLDPRRMDEVVDPIFVPKDPNKCGSTNQIRNCRRSENNVAGQH